MSGESSPHHQRARERRDPKCTGERDLLLAPLRLRAQHIERADALAAAHQRHVHAIIFGLGLHSCVNVPLVSAGKCIGTLNVLRADEEWSEGDVTLVRALGLAALAGVLMMR